MKRLLLGAAIALSLIGNAAAQDRNYQHRRMFVVKRDRIGDFEAAIKDLHAIYKKAGVVAPTLVVQSLTGEDNFLTIRYYSKLSEAMADRRAPFKNNHEGEYIAANIRLASTLAERQTVVSMREADLSVTGATEVPAYFRVVRTVVKPDKLDAYKALLKEYVDAGVKPGGVKSYTVLRTLMGREATEIATGMGVDSLAQLDDPPAIKAMGRAKYEEWLKRRAALVESTTVDLYRYRADLSTWVMPK